MKSKQARRRTPAVLPSRDAPTVAPIVRPTLHNEVVERLRALITEGKLLSDTRIPELALCKQFGISRTPLREALKVLAAEGLVTLTPHRGATVARLDSESVDYMFQVLEVLESLAGELACFNMPSSTIHQVREWHDDMMVHYKNREHGEYFRLNQKIHETIVKECGNPILVGIYMGLGSRVRYARYMVNLSEESWKQAVHEHEQIVEALSNRNSKQLARILRHHLRHKRAYVMNTLFKPKAASAA